MTAMVGPRDLKSMLNDEGELALLDVREEAVFGTGHLLFASSLPLGRLELLVRDLVPRRGTRIVLCDDGEGLAARAAERLGALGYHDTRVLEGGVSAWRRAGYVVFSGVNVPSKAFGEMVETTCRTPHITAPALKAKLDAGDDVIVLDSRPMREFRNMCIPGGINVPGAELAYRIADLLPSPDTLVVVNCAGRTRSIIGAQSLINAGIRNPVVALQNGTMGWHLAGFELERGMSRRAGPLSDKGLEFARAAARRVADRFGVATIAWELLQRWNNERDERSLYVLDVRSPEEYERGHLTASRSAPGGQLVQRTDAYVGTRGARVVLVDDDGVRATMTASWLRQMGWREVAVLETGPTGSASGGEFAAVAPVPDIPGLSEAEATPIPVQDLADALDRGAAVVVDLALSRHYEAGHIPGAWFALRSRLAAGLDRIALSGTLVLTSEDGALARLAAPEAGGLVDGPVRVLEGGTRAWGEAGLPLAQGSENLVDEPDDIYLRPYDLDFGVDEAMRAYLSWEGDLVDMIEADGDSQFHFFLP